MAKKKYKLHHTGFDSIIIAVIGGGKPLANMPMDYGKSMPTASNKPQVNTKGFTRVLKPKMLFKKSKIKE